ncbi:helix-turn-helix domain-containing protein [Amycolatopsis minnesotensis]|uniref:Helix-turn-helix domain-containing protein n=1 Tax=Amycolatopsis minnesotensis TaxID=337894 RepID=A0ABN2SCM3_9PSEU
MTSALESHTVLPDAGEANSPALARLMKVLEDIAPSGQHATLTSPYGESVPLPDEVYQVLREVVVALSNGLAINVAPLHAVLTTQQAADMLNVSRPTLVRLLEEGEIPFEKPGRHRRVRLADLLAYRDNARRHRRALLDQMTADAAEHEDPDDSADQVIQTR